MRVQLLIDIKGYSGTLARKNEVVELIPIESHNSIIAKEYLRRGMQLCEVESKISPNKLINIPLYPTEYKEL